MCDICDTGGQVLGPFLKPMSRLIHTEYFLAGRTSRDPREVLRDTMYAATVTGSPVQNACRLIRRYESEGRGYYGAALAILGRDADGTAVVDSPIVIRTADGVRRRLAGRRRPRHRGARPRGPSRRGRPEDRDVPAGGRRAARGPAPFPRGVPRTPGALRAARHPVGLQGHRVPGHPGRGRA